MGTIRNIRSKVRQIVKDASAKYALGKRMPVKTRTHARLWRLRNYLAAARKPVPVRTKHAVEFYNHYIERLRGVLSTPRRGPVIVAVGGIAGSGKSTLAKQMAEVTKRLYPDKELRVLTLSLDSYFLPRAEVEIRDKRGRVVRRERRIGVRQTPSREFVGGRKIPGEFDNPKALDLKKAIADLKSFREGKEIVLRERDIVTGRISHRRINPKDYDVVILEGLFALHAPLASKADVRVGLVATIGQQFLARAGRDITERNRPADGVATKFIERAPYQRAFVVPTLANADILLDVSEFRKSRYSKAMPSKHPTGRTPFDELLMKLGLATDYKRHPGWKKRTGNGQTPGLVPGKEHAARMKWIRATVRAPTPEKLEIIRKTLVRDADTSVREYCAWALGELKDERAYGVLKEAIFEDPSVNVRSAAIEALYKSQSPEKVVPVLAEVLLKGGLEKIDAVNILYNLGFWDDRSGAPNKAWAKYVPRFSEVPHIPDIIKEVKSKGWPMPPLLRNWYPEP